MLRVMFHDARYPDSCHCDGCEEARLSSYDFDGVSWNREPANDEDGWTDDDGQTYYEEEEEMEEDLRRADCNRSGCDGCAWCYRMPVPAEGFRSIDEMFRYYDSKDY